MLEPISTVIPFYQEQCNLNIENLDNIDLETFKHTVVYGDILYISVFPNWALLIN